MTSSPNILVILAHASLQRSRVNRRLAEAAAVLPHVKVRDLYEIYPDFDTNVLHEQSLLEAADLVVIQHPIQWYSMPSLLKEWFDVVLESGWACGEGGNALRGKSYWLVATTGGTSDTYRTDGVHQHPFTDFLPAQEQTARMCGMKWLPPHIFHGAHQADDASVNQYIATYIQQLETYSHRAAKHGT
ncbi:NAD(P)H-dependent oxidoreductase [Actimicrobium sp. CCC2.4]|uniref:glutathione-regulated potassium-efflux system oxidoreductase KefF n=1 Tax=Actimicrobium sp. CCC2.4 TaxID=3048606 RepID=UPI002AC8BEF0|nr:NAD(P)H-dependent oxidoreductase [Actimicrobium sp. CCC2.4]MEB0135405.1 NAD(P)H-dependent oxidoreductase [Actimicrobium sp. CCC2.4]WPX32421.1 NAD(P)H-dependent oxidoreductase [Actimicrobium sp. CCC2.4]